MKESPESVDAYLRSFSPLQQELLASVRGIILEEAPQAVESISYGMPAYKLNGKPLVYFALFKAHLGFYATPTGHARFAEALSGYKQGKGSVQFPLDQPLPLDLIRQIVQFRVVETRSKR